MEERLAALAHNVRRLREAHGLSLAQLAERTGVTKATLFRIESLQTNPTLDTVLRLCDALSVSIADLIALPNGSGVEVVRAGAGLELTDSAIQSRLVKSMMVGSTLIEIYDNTIKADEVEVSISHGPGTREHVIVQSGRLRVGPIDAEAELGPGDYATYASDRTHRWAAVGTEMARAWVIHTFPRPAAASAE